MMLKISCPACRHVGIVAGDSLPRLLICSSCQDRRVVDTGDCSGRVRSVSAAVDQIMEQVRASP
jgi:hypothetical protein